MSKEIRLEHIPAEFHHWYTNFGPPNSLDGLYSDINGENPVDTQYIPMPWWDDRTVLALGIIYRAVAHKNWWTTFLPWQRLDSTTIKWTNLIFHNAEMQRVPPGAAPRFLQTSVAEGGAVQHEYALGLTLDLDFYRTDKGRLTYQKYLDVVTDSILLCAYRRTMEAISALANSYSLWEVSAGNNELRDIETSLKQKVFAVGAMNKDEQEFARVLAAAKMVMKGNEADPDYLILPPNGTLALRGGPRVNDYGAVGPLSTQLREKGEKVFNHIEGLRVVETLVLPKKLFDDQTQPFKSVFEYGSSWVIKNFHGREKPESFTSATRCAIKMLDAKQDCEVTVTLLDVIGKSHRWESNGELSHYHQSLINRQTLGDLFNRHHLERDHHHVDMFVATDPSTGTREVISRWGEMEPHYLIDETITIHTLTANNMLSKVLTSEERATIENFPNFERKLSNPVASDIDFFAYNAALRYSMSLPDAENYTLPNATIAKPNAWGGIFPPIYSELAGVKKISIKVRSITTSLNIQITDQNIKRVRFAGTDYADAIQPTTRVPWGFGNPVGLLTLSHMFTANDHRGYDVETLRTAHKTVEAFQKIIPVLKKMAPNHELLNTSTCPFYYRTGNELYDSFIVFMTNLGSGARFPFFMRTGGGITDNFYVFSTTSGPDNRGLATDNANNNRSRIVPNVIAIPNDFADVTNAFMNCIVSGGRSIATLNGTKAADTNLFPPVRMTARLVNLYRNTTSTNARGIFTDGRLQAQLLNMYPIKRYGQRSLDRFLAEMLIGNDSSEDNDARQIGIFANVIDALLDDNIQSINWTEFLKGTPTKPARIGGRDAVQDSNITNVTDGTREVWGQWLNTRLHYDASVFRNIYEETTAADPSVAQPLFGFILPMNPFNPNVPLGADHVVDMAANADQNKATERRAVTRAMKYASGQMERNSVHTLTTSHVMSAHLERGKATASAEMFGRRAPSSGGFEEYRSVTHGFGSSFAERDILDLPEPMGLNSVSDLFSIYVQEENAFGQKTYERRYRPYLVQRFHQAASHTVTLERILTQLFLTTRVTLSSLQNWLRLDIAPPVACQLDRPRQSYESHAVIVAQGGAKTGHTYFCRPKFLLGQDPMSGVIRGKFSMGTAAVIQNEKNVMAIANALIVGYIGGESISYADTVQKVDRLWNDRNSKEGEIIVKMIPAHSPVPSVVRDISGIWNPVTIATTKINGYPNSFQESLGYSDLYQNHVLGLDRLNEDYAGMTPSMTNMNFTVNTEMWRAHHRICDLDGSWGIVVPDCGPWGNMIYPQCVVDRCTIGKWIKNSPAITNAKPL